MTPATSRVAYRMMREDDVPALLQLEAACFPSIPADRYWKPEMLIAHVRHFPEGQFIAERDGRLVGSATGFRINLDAALRPHTWRSITGNGYLTTQDANGDALYGTEIMVHPDARRGGIAKHLYRLRKDVVVRLNLRAFVAGGRIPGYHKHADKLSAVEYVKRVIKGDLSDRTLTPQLKAGLNVAGVMPGYLTDPDSHNHATILVWWNLEYEGTRTIVPSQGHPVPDRTPGLQDPTRGGNA